MPKTVRLRFTVKGRGRFPMDMLRYDCAWPARQPDVTALVQASGVPHELDEFEVTLYSDKQPTLGRWESFGWSVGAIERLP